MRTRRVLSLVVASFVIAVTAWGASGFKFESTVLYQPDEALRTRLGSAEELAAYIKRIEGVCAGFFASESTPERLDIVVGLKPEKKVRVWFVSSRRTGQDKSLVTLRKKLEAIPPCPVHGGPIALALRCTVAGASPPKDKEPYEPPMPKEWRDAIGGKPVLVPDGVFERIWH